MVSKTISINTGVDTDFFLDILGRDISTQACIYDLIDNSIDAAKRHKQQNDFSGYEILISIKVGKLTVIDNCGGFSEHELTSRAFITGKQSNHRLGLGKYGVGMKRAIVKIGKSFNLETDNGEASYSLTSKADQLSPTGTIDALISSSSQIGTKIEIFDLEHDVSCEFRDSTWNEQLLNEIGIRYSLFLNQGLSIKVSPIEGGTIRETTSKLPSLRSTPDIPLVKETKVINEVDVEIQAGLHKKYVITSKQGVNRKLTADFGWYIICNERVIAAAKKQGDEYGWTNKAWHSEYGGFVGFVYLTSEEPDKLPWNTPKTEVLPNHMVMVGIRSDLSRIGLAYKAFRKKAPKEDEGESQTENSVSDSNGTSSNTSQNGHSGTSNTPQNPNDSDNETSETEPLKTLSQVLGVKKNVGTKALMAFQEYQYAKGASSEKQGLKIARAAIIRAFIETSLKFHAHRLGVYDETEEEKKKLEFPRDFVPVVS